MHQFVERHFRKLVEDFPRSDHVTAIGIHPETIMVCVLQDVAPSIPNFNLMGPDLVGR